MDTSSTSNHGSLIQYFVPAQSAQVAFITSGPDGNLWFQSGLEPSCSIAKMNTNGVTLAQYPIPNYNISSLASGPNNALWATSANEMPPDGLYSIYSITTAGTLTVYDLPTGYSYPTYITDGPGGNLWFYEAKGTFVLVLGFLFDCINTTP